MPNHKQLIENLDAQRRRYFKDGSGTFHLMREAADTIEEQAAVLEGLLSNLRGIVEGEDQGDEVVIERIMGLITEEEAALKHAQEQHGHA